MGDVVRLFRLLIEWSRGIERSLWLIITATLTGAIAGLGSTALIAVINALFVGSDFSRWQLTSVFGALCVLVPLGGFLSGWLLMRLTAQAAYTLRLRMAERILGAPYRLLEELGAHRLMATINDDIPAVTAAMTTLPNLLIQVAVMVSCCFYLGWLSWQLLFLLLGYMALGILTYQLPLTKAAGYFRLLREQWDDMFGAIKALTEGAKELRLNRERRQDFHSRQLEPAIAGLQKYSIPANTLTIAAQNWGQALFFIFIGLTLFVSPMVTEVEQGVLSGYVLTVLYMIAPLTNILNNLPVFGRAFVAAEKIKKLGLSLGNIDGAQPALAKSAPTETAAPLVWQRLELKGITHVYGGDEDDQAFRLGPLSLTLQPGELIFLVGGNGSGKTTLAKLIIGLYEPDGGTILLDDKPISSEGLDDYRQLFSVVFYDFFLFDRLYGVDRQRLGERGEEYLKRLELDSKVQIKDDRLTTVDLSQGQRKRLALLTAYLEDRPVYVFDEWAADQDPVFTRFFYQRILPDLKASGKTVIAITHDDRFYHLADRLIKLERGQLDYDEAPEIAL